jgi:predicted nucleic acid-binding protein
LEAHAFASDYFRQRIPAPLQLQMLDSLRRRCRIVSLTARIQGVVSDPNDDHVLDAAVSAGVEYLVTGDRELQSLRSYHGVQIISPREFLEVLEQESNT